MKFLRNSGFESSKATPAVNERVGDSQGIPRVPQKRVPRARGEKKGGKWESRLSRSPNRDVGGVTGVRDCAKPFAVEPFDAAFEAATVALGAGNTRGDHVLGFTPVEIQLAIAFPCGELPNFSYVKSPHSIAMILPHQPKLCLWEHHPSTASQMLKSALKRGDRLLRSRFDVSCFRNWCFLMLLLSRLLTFFNASRSY